MLPCQKQDFEAQNSTRRSAPLANEGVLPVIQKSSFERKHHRGDSHPARAQNMPGRIFKHKKHRSQPANILFNKEFLTDASEVPTVHAPSIFENGGPLFDEKYLQNTGRCRTHSLDTPLIMGNLAEVNHIDLSTCDSPFQAVSRPKSPVSTCEQEYDPLTPGSPFSMFIVRDNISSSQVRNPCAITPSCSLNRATRPSLIQTTAPPLRGLVSRAFTRHNRVTHVRRHSVDTAPIRTSYEYFSSMQSGLPSPPNTAPLLPVGSIDIAPMPHPEYTTIAAFVESPSDFESDSCYSAGSILDDCGSSGASSPKANHLDIDILEQGLDILPSSTSGHNKGPLISSGSVGTGQGDNLPSLAPAPKTRITGNGITSRETRVPGGFVKASGISHEEISAFISGPEASDGKWVCLYSDCRKRFGRKENIKSHVQTHLGDRQYRCEVCKKCFVRQHDLKRHAKIHTGVKPYPCRCGNSFARHDALTRHRQRGMCIGAFEGIIKKVVKRGRPKKIRKLSDFEDRLGCRKPKNCSSGSKASSYSNSLPPTSPPALDDDGVLEMSVSPELPGSPLSTHSTVVQPAVRATHHQRPAECEPQRVKNIPGTASSEMSEKDYDPLFSGKFQNSGYEALELSEYTPPSSPPRLFNEQLEAVRDPVPASELQSLEADTSFTPIGSPTYDTVHRRLASAYNTPEWDAPNLNNDTSDTLDLGDILGFSEFVSDPTFDAGTTSDSSAWRKNPCLDLNMGLELNIGMEMNLTEDAFDFIKPELLHEENLEFFGGKS